MLCVSMSNYGQFCAVTVPVSCFTDARVGFSSMQYITSEGEAEVQVAVTVQSSLDLIMERVSGNFTISLSAGGTAIGMYRRMQC